MEEKVKRGGVNAKCSRTKIPSAQANKKIVAGIYNLRSSVAALATLSEGDAGFDSGSTTPNKSSELDETTRSLEEKLLENSEKKTVGHSGIKFLVSRRKSTVVKPFNLTSKSGKRESTSTHLETYVEQDHQSPKCSADQQKKTVTKAVPPNLPEKEAAYNVSQATVRKRASHSGLKFNMNHRKETVVKPFSFNSKLGKRESTTASKIS